MEKGFAPTFTLYQTAPRSVGYAYAIENGKSILASDKRCSASVLGHQLLLGK